MIEKIKLAFVTLGKIGKEYLPYVIRGIKAAIKFGIPILMPIALDAVQTAERSGGTGEEKFKMACEIVKAQAPKAIVGAIMKAVQDAWAIKEAEGWN